jgi:hypothetical protein
LAGSACSEIQSPEARRDGRITGVALFVISGVPAAGKSTVARLLAERFERGVCLPSPFGADHFPFRSAVPAVNATQANTAKTCRLWAHS